jgi:hypothetical protein
MQARATQVRWKWLQGRLESDPAWIGRVGARAALLLAPFWGLVLLAGALVALGMVSLSDFSVRARAGLDPRLATLLLLTGVGTWGVLGARWFWG